MRPITLAIRSDSANSAAMLPMSRMTSSSKRCPRSTAKSASSISLLCSATSSANALPRRQPRLAVVGRDQVGDKGIFRADTQDRTVRDHPVRAGVRARGGDHDHLALRFGQAAIAKHQRIVVGEDIMV